ncbi:alcohol dehydrogenase [Brevibacillus choshinensis]|uniref:Alcohol dehydrogenase n=1 Tax=Brevibacillus choshinensis TaxID=54911 RepID=A0ABR5NEJ5_BRECH|nr:NADP-dependent oxidoreductase [Brevibacillus choshinensis]KQL49995.1 alcohol dehydrogenase [Brevibacillus choshinensis]
MTTIQNRQILLAKRPAGMPTEENFSFVETAVPKLQAGQLLVNTLYLSVDPYMRGRMNDRKTYVPPYALNEMITGGVVGQVEESLAEGFVPGDIVLGNFGWALYNVAAAASVKKVNPDLAPISTALGVLGMPGLTAYYGLLDIGQPKEGETVVVSGAAGAVGMLVGQIAKIKGARAVGIAGSDEKINYLVEELGFDAAVNYKKGDLRQQLKEACPSGVDIYFDNVGGTVSDAVLSLINKGTRIPLCGRISLYNLEQADIGPRIQTQLLINSALMQGFIVSNYAEQAEEGLNQMAQWLKEGKINYTETITEGFDNIPKAFLGLFCGENTGKQLIKIADPAR